VVDRIGAVSDQRSGSHVREMKNQSCDCHYSGDADLKKLCQAVTTGTCTDFGQAIDNSWAVVTPITQVFINKYLALWLDRGNNTARLVHSTMPPNPNVRSDFRQTVMLGLMGAVLAS
jgi:hypothetical protein